MNYRICDHVRDTTDYGENDIYRKFKYQFDNLFNKGEVANNDTDFEAMYVEDANFEESIITFLQSINSVACFCVGYTGIGKTTSIRHCLELGVSNKPVLTTRSFRNSAKRMVIFPTFLDGFMPESSFDLPRRIAAVCTSLEEAYPELLLNLKTTEGKKEFYNFIREHSSDIVETLDEWNQEGLSEDQLIVKKLNHAIKCRPLAYFANKLKYYIIKKQDVYDRLVIVLDDIEGLPEIFQDKVIGDYLHLFSCMKNTDYPGDSEYRVNLLVSVRPHTYRILINGSRSRLFETYPIEPPILKQRAIDLKDLFEKRFNHYTSLSPRTIGNVQSWNDCYQELMKMNNAFDGKYKEMLINLNFMNLRAALAWYSRVFSNRFWIQENRTKMDIFTVCASEYNFNNITVIRAVGCGNKSVFTGVRSLGDAPEIVVPNLFLTSEDSDYSVQCLLVIQYFYRKLIPRGSNAPVAYYGLNASSLKSVYNEWSRALDAKHVKQLKDALKYLFECKILRKSILDSDDYKTLDLQESIDESSRLYISPRGTELFDMLTRDSVLLEMMRECAWRDYECREPDYKYDCSYDLMRNGRQKDIFIDLLEYIEAMRETEEDFFSSSEDAIAVYRSMFGSKLVVERLFAGVEKSLQYSGNNNDPVVYQKYYRIRKQIEESRKRLNI